MRFPRTIFSKSGWTTLTALTALSISAAAQAQVPIVQPGAPGQAGRIITAEEASDLAGISYSLGDIQFLRGMTPHHAQAKEMSALAEDRTNNPTVLAVAARITLSQDDEISMIPKSRVCVRQCHHTSYV